MTELLYIQDFDVLECEATVVSINHTDDGRADVVLDKTCFYARGGGQDWDKGKITSSNEKFQVDEVHMDEQAVVHHIGKFSEGSLSVGDTVSCAVDKLRRTLNTRLHSAAHVIDMAIAQLGLDWLGTKGQHFPNLSAIEYSGSWDPEQAEELRAKIESLANELAAKDIENKLLFMPVEEMHKVCRHVPDNIPKNKPGRVVMYGDDFGVPCGGTHVKNLKQVGVIKIPKLKQKKGVIRLSYSVEGIN